MSVRSSAAVTRVFNATFGDMAEFCGAACQDAFYARHAERPTAVVPYGLREEPPLGLFMLRSPAELQPLRARHVFALFQQACAASLARPARFLAVVPLTNMALHQCMAPDLYGACC